MSILCLEVRIGSTVCDGYQSFSDQLLCSEFPVDCFCIDRQSYRLPTEAAIRNNKRNALSEDFFSNKAQKLFNLE
jgi:hypothetical protein